MLARRLPLPSLQSRVLFVCLSCTARTSLIRPPHRPFSATTTLDAKNAAVRRRRAAKKLAKKRGAGVQIRHVNSTATEEQAKIGAEAREKIRRQREEGAVGDVDEAGEAEEKTAEPVKRGRRKRAVKEASAKKGTKKAVKGGKQKDDKSRDIPSAADKPMSLKEALLASTKKQKGKQSPLEPLEINVLEPGDLDFTPIHVEIPAVPRLGYGLDRVLFNPGVYRLQDPSSRVYNFDPYLEKILPVKEFDFGALSEYKTSSRDEELLALNRRLGTKFTGSTSSMSGVLQHFHFLLSAFRKLDHSMLSRGFPTPASTFSKLTLGPDAIFLRYKDGRYAIDADKSYDEPNIMSWLGHSLEKLLTTDRAEFERYRRSNPDQVPKEDDSSRCYHYSTLGNFLMRSQLDAHDARLPGSGIFDLKTRAVVSIRMDHKEYEVGSGYQLHHARGQWESFEREFYDMTRATMLKYSLQVRMGRMNGIFVAYHNIERIFGFQYLPLSDMDEVLHGQSDPFLGDQEFRASIHFLDELLQKATAAFPETTIRLHFHAQNKKIPFMYIFAEPVTEEQADEIQNSKQAEQKAFARDIVGIDRNDPEVQQEWHDIQERVNHEMRGQVDGNEEADGLNESQTVEEDAVEKDEEGDVIDDVEESEDGAETEEEAALIKVEDAASNSDAGGESVKTAKTKKAKPPMQPLMGWTLTIRNRVNGTYVDRPENLTSADAWSVEYHIKEIAPDDRWALYEKVKKDRHKLLGQSEEDRNKSLATYRAIIHSYSQKGRAWREQQDEAESGMEKQIFRPMGPGSGGVPRNDI